MSEETTNETTSTEPEFEELSNLEELEESIVGLRAEDKKHADGDKQTWFKGSQGTKYRVSFVYFQPLIVAAAIMAKTRAKEKGETLSKAQLGEIARKVLAKRAADLKKPVEELLPHEKLDTSECVFNKILAHYKENFGYAVSRLGKDGGEADMVWNMLGEVKTYYTTVLLIYPSDKNGEIDQARKAHWEVTPWRLSQKVYTALHTNAGSLRANQLRIGDQDLIIECTNKDYQNFDKIQAAGPAAWRRDEAMKQQVLVSAGKLYDKLQPFRTMTTAEVRLKLGMSDTPVGAAASGGGGKEASQSDVADLLASL